MSVQFPGMTWSPDFPILGGESSEMADILAARKRGHKEGEAEDTTPAAPEEKRKVTLAIDQADYAKAAIALADSAHLNVAADSFTLAERFNSFPSDAPLGSVLKRMAATFRLKRKWGDGALLLRRERWEDLLEEEPPAEILDRVTETVRKRGRLAVEDMSFLAAHLTRKQIIGLSRWHSGPPMSMVGPAAELLSHYALYSWMGSLSSDQLGELQGSGLKCGSLNAKQTATLAGIASHTRSNAGTGRLGPRCLLTPAPGGDVYPPPLVVRVLGPDGRSMPDIR